MGWGSPDAYYQPEQFGLTPVAEIDYSDGCYNFDIRVVWKHEDGGLLTARDAGCSCPSPFEEHTSLDTLYPVNFEELKAEVEYEATCDYSNISEQEGQLFLEKVRNAV